MPNDAGLYQIVLTEEERDVLMQTVLGTAYPGQIAEIIVSIKQKLRKEQSGD